jgi:DNA mismatch repair ATPase MutS
MAHDRGLKALVALRGSNAISLAREFKPGAITLDINLPDIAGWTILDRLKHDPATRHIPVHIISGDEDRRRGLALGAMTYLEKAVVNDSLAEAFNTIQRSAQPRVKKVLVGCASEDDRDAIADALTAPDIDISFANAAGEVLAAIRRCILPNGEISDDASPTLRRIRMSMVQTRDSIQKTLKQILRSRNTEAGEDYVTLRNDRFVIPVRAENRRGTPGVVHGASATGQTVFLEPLETVEPNNQLVQLSEDEAAEILRVLRELTERLQGVRPELLETAEIIAMLDGVFARGRFARDFDAALPEFSANGDLRLEAARHPVLQDKLKREQRAIVAMNLSLNREERLLVISGPNTGGKTVALKTTGLAALAGSTRIDRPGS